MKKVLLFASIFIVGASLSFAQVNSGYDGPKPEVHKGAMSFVFLYTPFQSNLNPVPVSTVSQYPNNTADLFGAGFRYFITNEIALGAGLNFGSRSSETIDAQDDKTETTETTFGLAIDANYHLKPLYSVSPYVGLNVNYGNYSYTVDETVGGTTTTTESSGTGFGVGVNFGFDWYFTEGLSLGGRYTLGYQSLGKPESKSGNTTVEGTSRSEFGIGTASVILNVHL
jgi:opacity protein-like surface antigen